jgi:hypothetical protein
MWFTTKFRKGVLAGVLLTHACWASLAFISWIIYG